MKQRFIIISAISVSVILALAGSVWAYTYLNQQRAMSAAGQTARSIQELVERQGTQVKSSGLSAKTCRDVYGGKDYFNQHPQFCFYFASAEVAVSDTDGAYNDIKAGMDKQGWRHDYQLADCLTLYATQVGSFKNLDSDNSDIECFARDYDTVVIKIIHGSTISVRYETPS